MRLLNSRTAGFICVDEPRHVSYAILSHVWARPDEEAPAEQTFIDISKIQRSWRRKKWFSNFSASSHLASNTKGNSDVIPARVSEKIRRTCAVAREHGYDNVWIDSCCIDQSSSSELSEAINSMYQWYHHARVCYAYLADVHDEDDPRARDSQFRRSRWFTRGWTLQELIAPQVLVFLSKGWRVLGTKAMLAAVIEEVTGIDSAILTHHVSLDTVSVAKRISWASRRHTTREEDEAYSLMGILNVHMPTIYGEGRFAFIRLQEEVLKQTSDQTLFAWGPSLRDNVKLEDDSPTDLPYMWEESEAIWESPYMRNLFALSPRDFLSSGSITTLPRPTFLEKLHLTPPLPQYHVTGHGIHTTVPLLTGRSYRSGEVVHLAILACQDEAGRLLALILNSQERTRDEYYVGAFLCPTMSFEDNHPIGAAGPRDVFLGESYFRTIHLSTSFVAAHREGIRVQEVYIPHRPSRTRALAFQEYTDTYLALAQCEGPFEVHLAGWCKSVLEKEGFAASPLVPDNEWNGADPRKHAFIITRGERTFKVELDACGCEVGMSYRWLRVVVSRHPDLHDSLSFDTIRQNSTPRHARDHPDHVYSWTFDAGSASRHIHVVLADGQSLTIQLTLRLSGSRTMSHARTYVLGVEIVEPQRREEKQSLESEPTLFDNLWVPPIIIDDREDFGPVTIRT